MFRLMIVLAVVGAALLVGGISEYRVSSAAKADPQRISCAQLGRDGPGDNVYVTLTDFKPSPGAFVYEAKDSDATTGWTSVWVPLIPAETVAATGPLSALRSGTPDFKVILYSKQYHSEAEVTSLVTAPEVTGMVINKIRSLGSKERDLLASGYPGVDFSNVWIIEHERKPHGTAFVALLLGGGGLLILVALGWFGGKLAHRW